MPPAPRPVLERFEEKAWPDPNSGCWLWAGTFYPSGYGVMRISGGNVYSHRVAYELFRGPIPPDKQIDHLCRQRWCVNPDHLDLVTGPENTRRALPFRKPITHCANGHEFTPENTYWQKSLSSLGGKQRYCKICHTEKVIRVRAARLAKGRKIDGKL